MSRRVIGRRTSLAMGCALIVGSFGAGVHAAAAQTGLPPVLEGQVLLRGEPLSGVDVVLHRVSLEQAGELDTIPAGPAGRFRFTLPSMPTSEAEGDVYFASVRYGGILYFGRPVARAAQLDSLYPVEVFDTTSAPAAGAPFRAAARYLVVESDGAGAWRVTDVFEVLNDTDRTVIAVEGGVTWRHPLPAGITGVQIGGGDLSPGAARVEDGELRLTGPIGPGTGQFVLRYTVPALDGLTIPVLPSTGSVEFLVAEPAPSLEVSGLSVVDVVEVQPGVPFRRWVGEQIVDGFLEVREVEVAGPRELPMRWIMVVLSLVLAVGGLWAASRGVGTIRASDRPIEEGGRAGEDRQALLLEVARLDEQLETTTLGDDERVRLRGRREALITRIRNLG